MTAPALVRLEAVTKSYREGGAETPVLQGAALALACGETTSLVGSSGSGKSTLLGIIAGILDPDAGTVTFDGTDLRSLDEGGRARLRARRMGVVLQRGNLVPFLSARENVELAFDLAGNRRPSRSARALLADLGLADRADHLPSRLSGGEAQRAALAVALANEPDLLLADEVTGELDDESAAHVLLVVEEASARHGLTVLFVTHSQALAQRATTRLRLADGIVQAA